jgi:hypothetical protein
MVQVSACDPGRSTRTGHRSLEDALTLADQRDFNIDNALGGGFGNATATCVGNLSLDDHPLLDAENAANKATSGPTTAQQRTIDRELLRLGAVCQKQD